MISGGAGKRTAQSRGVSPETVSGVHVCAALQLNPHVFKADLATLPELIVAELAAMSRQCFCCLLRGRW